MTMPSDPRIPLLFSESAGWCIYNGGVYLRICYHQTSSNNEEA
jgi:hypothetical protein